MSKYFICSTILILALLKVSILRGDNIVSLQKKSDKQNIEKWYEYKSVSGLSFLMPVGAQRLTKSAEHFDSEIFQTKNNTCVFGIVCTDFSKLKEAVLPENYEKLYSQLKLASVSMETLNLVSEKEISNDSVFIKEIEYTIVDDGFQMTYFKRFMFKGTYVYQASIGGRTRHIEQIVKEKGIYFDSMKFPKTEDVKMSETTISKDETYRDTIPNSEMSNGSIKSKGKTYKADKR